MKRNPSDYPVRPNPIPPPKPITQGRKPVKTK